MQMIINFYLPL